jgi:hypothetical protein
MKACISLSVSALATPCCKVVTSRSQVCRIVVGERVTARRTCENEAQNRQQSLDSFASTKGDDGASLTRDVVKMALVTARDRAVSKFGS